MILMLRWTVLRSKNLNYLIDTQILIWHINGANELPKKIKMILDDRKNNFYISVASIWEIVIKLNYGKLELNCSFDELYEILETYIYEILPINEEHLKSYLTLPIIHKDPFDRMLISTSLAENLQLITSDEEIHKYKVNWVW